MRGRMPRKQLVVSAKAPADRSGNAPVRARTPRRSGARQEGTLWQRKMRTLATKLSEHQRRFDRSGAPMKRV